jgi:hypothetical protein
LTGVLRSLIVTSMLMLDRDRQIVLSIGRFGQLSTKNLNELHFHDRASMTPMYRTLERLVERKYLARIERRMVGGTGAGSGQYVYQLGSAGWTFCRREGRYWPYRAVSYHTLAIADAYIELLKLERSGAIRIDGFSTEPDSWLTVAGADLRPDLHVDVADLYRRRSVSLWLEIDMGTERQKQVKDKLARYWHAYQHADSSTLPVVPLVLFIAPDEARERELKWMIDRGPEEAQALFMVSNMDGFASLLFR